MEPIASANEEAIEAWNGVLFDRFVAYRDIVTTGLGAHGEEALRWSPPRVGERAIDIGCGFGDTTRRLAELVGPDGEALGVDVAERFIEVAQAEAAEAGSPNVRFAVADVQVGELEQGFDYAFSRMGIMFFANPVVALRNVRGALVPGGRLCAVVWRRKSQNEWMAHAEQVVARFELAEEAPEEPTCGPGPFSMGDADVTTSQLLAAGFEEVAVRRCDLPIKCGDDLAGAVQFALALGPAGEAMRKAGPAGERVRPQIEAAIAESLKDSVSEDGSVWMPASTWILTARAPKVD
jgi:SAM-dependent methyltransferase